MNKLTKLLSVFALAGAIGAGVAGAAGCAHKHTYEDKWTSAGADGHYHVATCHEDQHDDIKPHTWDNDQDTTCNDCGYTRTVTPSGPENPGPENPGPSTGDEKVKAPAGLSALIVEEVGDKSVQLSAEKKSHTIDKAGIKVYYGTGDRSNPTKGDEVPAANLDIRLLDPSNQACESWEGLKVNGTYTVIAKLKDVVSSTGAALNADLFQGTAKVTVINEAKSFTLKEGATLTQDQSVVDSMTPTWSYEITRDNEEKEDVAAKDVHVFGVDHVHAGTDKKATISTTVDGKEVKGSVTYTINAVQGAVVQSYAVNANTLEVKSHSDAAVLNEDGKISLTAKSGKEVAIDANNKSVDGKSFTQRIKLGGSPIKNGALDGETMFRTIQLEDVNKTTTEGATSKTLVTVYAISSSAGTDTRNLSLYKEGEKDVPDTSEGAAEGATRKVPTLTKIANSEHAVDGNTVWKCTYVVDDTGTFHIGSESGGINIYYIQIDRIVTGETDAEEVSLSGSEKVIGLSLVTTEAKTVYKKADGSVDTSAITGKVTIANEVTAESKTEEVENTALSFDTSKVDFTKLGEYTITVTYGEGSAAVKATYNITVESDVDGVKGASADLNSDLSTTVATADAKLTLKKSDIEVALDYTKAEVEGLTVTYTVKKDDETEIDDTTGVEFAIGTHTLTVEITVTDGTNTATFNKEITLTVKKQLAPGEVENVKVTFTAADVTTIGESATSEAIELRDGITIGTNCKAKSESVTVDGQTYSNRVQLGGTFKKADGVGKNSIKLEVAKAATIKVIYKAAGSSGTRPLNLYKDNGDIHTEGNHSADGAEATFTVTAGGTYYLGSGSSGINIWQIEIIYE